MRISDAGLGVVGRRSGVDRLLACAAVFGLCLAGLQLAGCASGERKERASAPAINSTAFINGEEAPAPEIPMGDPRVLARIIEEGTKNNRVMEHLTYLCEEIGPRLTASSRLEEANEWTRRRFEEWGLSNAHLDEWGTASMRFDRGPSSGTVYLRTEGRDGEVEYRGIRDMELTTLSWAPGTDGPERGPVVKMPETYEELLEVEDRITGAWVMHHAERAASRRGIRGVGGMLRANYADRQRIRAELAELGENGSAGDEGEVQEPDSDEILRRVLLAGPAGFISSSRDERVWTTSVTGWRAMTVDDIAVDTEVMIRQSDYDFINSRIFDGIPIEVEFDLRHTFTPGPIPLYNTIAEIPGTEWPDEYVIVSGHLDSWDGPGSQGTTDNGTGTSVTLEAARLLMEAGAQPKRTIRFILWTGEEQGLLGSRAYVEEYADKLDRISAVFVDDSGTNYQAAIRCADYMAPMLAAATAPTNHLFYSEEDGGWLNVDVRASGDSIPASGGSDHVPFLRAGVPAFFWQKRGRAVYGYGWHTQNDRLDLAIPEYLEQASTNTAITAYNLACAPTLLPREAVEEEVAEEPVAAAD